MLKNPNEIQMETSKRRTPADNSNRNSILSSSSMSRSSLIVSVLLSSCLCLVLLPEFSHGYNIDLPSYITHRREPNTMFGFSLAFHNSKARTGLANSLVVGAPKFDTSSYQPGVVEAGAVFKCGMNDGDCNLVKFDSLGNHQNSYGDVIERKSYQWLGATIATSRENDLVVACAPRYVFHTMTPAKSLRYDPVGTCFTSRNFANFSEVSPCRTNNWGYHRQGSCQAGFSAAASRKGDRMYIGAPGSWYWQGQTYSYDVTRMENQVFSSAESGSQDDDSYLGYSMTTGDFNGDKVDDVAIGMPRGAGLLGKIVVNGLNMAHILNNITGHQIGEYFGYALATCDVNGDGLDDLIIGAPMYSEHGNVEGKYDVGRVYIRVQKSGSEADRLTTEIIREGYNTKGRFGLAITTLGDINRDSYGDFAVGAPYDGPEGRGIVYIFHGSANGPREKPSQILKSEDIVEGAPYPRTFGFALAGGIDMDGNTYPDLAVGAYASDQVFIFKARPVAAVSATTEFVSSSKLINLEEKNCTMQRDRKNVTCTNIRACWSYRGDQLPAKLVFDVSWVLDAKKPKNPRMFFQLYEGKNTREEVIELQYGIPKCLVATVFLSENVDDKLSPLEVETRYNLRSSRQSLTPVIRRRRDALEPVIDQNRENVQRDAINILKNCGPDNICIPDLRLETTHVEMYHIGALEPLTVNVLITNNRQDAFEAAFYMVMPKDLDFKKVKTIGDKADTTITCSAPSEHNNHTLKCNIGNPLPAGKVVHFNVEMQPSHKAGMSPSYDFFMEVNSTNEEDAVTRFDNINHKSIGIWVQTDLEIKGRSYPDFQLYKASDYKSVENSTKEEDLGPQVVHLYNILNKGPAAIEEAVVLIHYPYETAAGDLLMYMTNQPETDGHIRCDPHVSVNSRNLQLDQNLVRKSYLELRGAVERAQGEFGPSFSRPNAVPVGRETNVLSIEETKRLEKEDEQDVSGDASYIHSQRANAAASNSQSGYSGGSSGGSSSSSSSSSSWNSTSGGRYSGGGGGGTGGGSSSFSSWNSTSGGRGRPSIIVSTKNTTVHYDASGQPHVVESSTEYVRELERAPGYYSQQQSANYQQGGGGANAGAGRQIQTNSQHYQQQQPRGNILLAGPQGGSSNYQQSHTNYGNTGGSSGGAYRPHQQQQQYNNQRVGSSSSYNDLAGNTNMEKVAQGQHGFQAGALDLGMLNRGNTDNELRDRNSQDHGYHQTYSSSGYVPQGGGATYHQSSYNSGGKPYYGMENEDYYDEENGQQSAQQQGGGQQWSHSSSSSSQRRVRREETAAPTQIDLNSPCKAAKCETLRCVATNLGKDEGAWVAIRTRMVAKTMEKLASNVPLNVSTMAVSYVTKLPYIGEPKDEIIKSHEIFYKAVPEPTPVPDVVPLWVVVLAACAGALILLLLVFLLYKCGFFNRNRPVDHSMERQPLRNGYHGDEHL